MMNLKKIFENVFDDPALSDGRFIKFAEILLIRMIANNPEGILTAYITLLAPVVDAFRTALAEKAVIVAQREGKTDKVDQLMAELKAEILVLNDLITYTYRKAKEKYQEFYPHSTHEYTRMNKTNGPVLIKQFVTACTNNLADFPGDELGRIISLANSYTTATSAQEEKKAGVSGKQQAKDTVRSTLEIRVQKTWLHIAEQYVGQPDKYDVYFQNSLLKPYRHKPRGGGDDAETRNDTYVLAAPMMSIARAEFTLIPGETFNFYNNGDAPLSIYAALTQDAPVPEGALLLAPGAEQEITVENLGPAGSTFLLVNNNTAYDGSLEIALV
jgi:hypothetical protein